MRKRPSFVGICPTYGLFVADGIRLPSNGTPTSNAAAASMEGRPSDEQRQKVLAAIVASGERGLTDAEGEEVTGLRHQSYTPRRLELERMGLVRAPGEKRATPSGRGAMVWVAVGKAQEKQG